VRWLLVAGAGWCAGSWCWLPSNFFLKKTKKVWKYGKIIVPLQPKCLI
jgi:hypothetical protein